MQKHKDCDEICMGQLQAFSPWISRGHQRMVQTRSVIRIAEETRREFAWAPMSLWPKDYDDDDDDITR